MDAARSSLAELIGFRGRSVYERRMPALAVAEDLVAGVDRRARLRVVTRLRLGEGTTDALEEV